MNNQELIDAIWRMVSYSEADTKRRLIPLLNKERPEHKFMDWDRLTLLEDENAKLKAELENQLETIDTWLFEKQYIGLRASFQEKFIKKKQGD